MILQRCALVLALSVGIEEILPSALAAQASPAQKLPTPAATAKQLQGDFAVPDAPALVMINGDDSKLLRPSSVQEFTSNLSSSSGDFSFIPKAFGVEFSPLMLFKGSHLSIGEYQQNPMLYRARLSLAARRDSATNRSLVGLGFRMSMSDKSDLRTDPEFLRAIDVLTALKVDSMRARTKALAALKIPVVGSYTPEQQKRVDSLDKALTALAKSGNEAIEAAEARVKRAREATQWNADVFDIAAALRASGADSVANQTRFDGVAGWATKGWRLGSVSQLLLGARGAYERDTLSQDLKGTGDAVSRLYVGSNTYKLLIEAQATSRESSAPKWGFKAGGEFEAAKSIWLEFSAGWERIGSHSGGLTQSVKFHLAPPNS